jgi:hypothetical protein
VNYLSFLVGSKDNTGSAIAVDPTSGVAYITGSTSSKDFVTTNGAWQKTFGGGLSDAFVASLNAKGDGLNFSTYLGTEGVDAGDAIAVSNTAIEVAGDTSDGRAVFDPNTQKKAPTKFGSLREGDVFVARLTLEGGVNAIVTVGGNRLDTVAGITLDQEGNAYFTGATHSSDASGGAFPTKAAEGGAIFQSDAVASLDAYVAKLGWTADHGKPALVYSTYFGGAGEDQSNGIALDRTNDSVVIVGTTTTPVTKGFGLMNPLKPGRLGKVDSRDFNAFVAEFDAKGNPRTADYFVYLSGSQGSFGTAIAPAYGIGPRTSARAEFFISGYTFSNDDAAGGFPTPGNLLKFRGTKNETPDGFVALLDPKAGKNVASLLFNTYVGGSGTPANPPLRPFAAGDQSLGVAVNGKKVDDEINVYTTGFTNSTDFPPPMPAPNAFQTMSGGDQDAFVVRINGPWPVFKPQQPAPP